MNKPLLVLSAPIDTYSGYGARGRDIAKALIELDKYDVKLLSQMWGSTPWNFIGDHEDKWGFLKSHFMDQTNQNRKPDIWVQLTVPNEFQPIGKYNIGITAGIEATQCSGPWLEGVNKMDLVLTSSEFSKEVFDKTIYDVKDKQGNLRGQLKCTAKLDVLLEGVNLDVYNKETKSSIIDIPEDFAFLVAGHWLKGDHGEDRKNIGKTLEIFFRTFRKTKNAPALILKTGSDGSISEQEELINKINTVRKIVGSDNLPKVYLLSGNLTDSEMNELYRHPKIKSLVSFTKGEGFGRPLAEFALTKKPIICSNWSGHTDFIKPEFGLLVGGKLENIHKSAAWENVLMEEAKWFNVDELEGAKAMLSVFEHYKKYSDKARSSRQFIKENFSFEVMKDKLEKILDENVKVEVELKLPTLNLPKLDLPKLNK